MRELGEKFGFLVILVMDVVVGKVDLQLAESSGGADLSERRLNVAAKELVRLHQTHRLSLDLFRGCPEGTDGCHLVWGMDVTVQQSMGRGKYRRCEFDDEFEDPAEYVTLAITCTSAWTACSERLLVRGLAGSSMTLNHAENQKVKTGSKTEG